DRRGVTAGILPADRAERLADRGQGEGVPLGGEGVQARRQAGRGRARSCGPRRSRRSGIHRARHPTRMLAGYWTSAFGRRGLRYFTLSIVLIWSPLIPPRVTGVAVSRAGTSARPATWSLTENGFSPKRT